MQMPAQLPAELRKYSASESDEELMKTLSQNSVDFLIFFENAVEDETWSERHSAFMHLALEWLTLQALHERLSQESIQKISELIHKHYSLLKEWLPNDLTIKIKENAFPMNSLLLIFESDVFRELIHIKCHLQNEKEITLYDITPDHFRLIQEYIYTHAATGLWKLEKKDLFELIREADVYKLPGFKYICEENLKKYIDMSSVFDLLIKAHKSSWNHLKQLCFDFINTKFAVKLTTEEEEHEVLGHVEMSSMSFEFLEFTESTLELFTKLKNFITQIVCRGTLTIDPAFSKVMQAAPNLIGIDINGSQNFTERLFDIPVGIEKLDISSCAWLSDEAFHKIVAIVPHLKKLSLESNLELTYSGFKELQKLHELRSLDISRNPHLRDDDFSLILKACPHLIELKLSRCSGLSDKAFFQIGKTLPQLLRLDVSHTAITDGMLLEIVARCEQLRELDISGCHALSEKCKTRIIKKTG